MLVLSERVSSAGHAVLSEHSCAFNVCSFYVIVIYLGKNGACNQRDLSAE